MKKNKIDYDKMHIELEKKGLFDQYTVPFDKNKAVPIDKDYVYLPRNKAYRLYTAFVRGILYLVSPVFNYFIYGLVVKGKENLKLVQDRGVISVSNHVMFLDNLLIRQGIGRKKSIYYTVAPHNAKKGIFGVSLKAGGILPLPDNISATKNFNATMHKLLNEKHIVHIYAEKAMWLKYEKPRPLKKGAFHYAVKENAPILPVFLCFREPRGIRKALKLSKPVTLLILEPLFPENYKDIKNNVEMLKLDTEQRFIEAYKDFYNITRENIYDTEQGVLEHTN